MTQRATATTKQINYALALIGRAGYDTRYMTARHKTLGAGMQERSGTVETWLAGMSRARISNLIDTLKAA